jgi:hypothetical protein
MTSEHRDFLGDRGAGNPVQSILGWSFRLPPGRHPEWRAGLFLLIWMLFDAIVFARSQLWLMLPAAVIVPLLSTWIQGLAIVGVGRVIDFRPDTVQLGILGASADLLAPLRADRHAFYGLAGPAISLLIGAICLLAAGLPLGVIVPDPMAIIMPFFSPAHAAAVVAITDGHAHALLVYVGLVNLGLGLLNLLPVPPLLGARVWRAVLWPMFGFRRGLLLAAYAAFAICAIWTLLAIWSASWTLLFVAIMFWMSAISVFMAMRLGFDPVLQASMEQFHPSPPSFLTRWSQRRAENRAIAEENLQAREQELLDRLLAKVSEHGLPSLTAGERRQLQDISKRQRERDAGIS